MGATPAISAAQRAGVWHEVHRYRHDPRAESFGDEAVAALAADLGIAEAQVLKTLVVEVDGHLGVAVVPVPDRLALKTAAAALGGTRARMADPRDVTRATGYVLGGVSPLGQRRRLPTVVEAATLRWDVVLCSAGRRGLEIALAPGDLVALTGAGTACIVV